MSNRRSRMIRRGARTLLPVLLFGLLFVLETGASERATAADPAVALQPGFTVIVWEQPDQDVAGAVSHLNAREDRVSHPTRRLLSPVKRNRTARGTPEWGWRT